MLEKLPVTENYYYVAFIAAFTFALTMITAKGGLTDHRFKWYKWKRYTTRGKQSILIGFIIVLLLFFQEINNRNVSNFNEIKLSRVQNSRNEEIKKGVEKATDTLFYKLSLAFKKQGFQYDSIKNEIRRVRDSVKIMIDYGDTPLITVRNLKIIDSTNFDKSYSVVYDIMSNDAQSLNMNLKFDVFGYTYNSKLIPINLGYIITFKGQDLGKNQFLSGAMYIPKEPSIYSKYFFRLKGSYNSNNNNKKIKVDKFYVLKPRVKIYSFGNPFPEQEEYLRAYLKQNNID